MTGNNPVVNINIVVLNGEKYIRHCLDAVLKQTFEHGRIGFNILDNGSDDKTQEIIKEYLPRFSNFHHTEFIKSSHNLGMWGGHEKFWLRSQATYEVTLSVDVIMEDNFVKHAVAVLDKDPKVGALQAKIYQFDIDDIAAGKDLNKDRIDTCGFRIFRSRKIGNIGHREVDRGQFDNPKEIFGVEGAVPVFRRSALMSIKVLGEIADRDLFWYGEDLDVAWRIRLAGWKEIYDPTVIAWHDRGTTKSHAHGGLLNHLARVPLRHKISIKKRRLEWRNTRWTRVKNDYIINILKDLPYIFLREAEILGYTILFEPGVLAEVPRFIKGLPKMFRKRRQILKQTKVSSKQIHAYFLPND